MLMNLKRILIERLPPKAKQLLAIPYDLYQTRSADRQFKNKSLPAHESASDAPQHIVCVVVDALRADHVTEETTPYLTTLNGTDAITPGTWTFPAMSSFISGVYPHEHGAVHTTETLSKSEQFTLPPKMDDDRVTLTETLAGAGYDTYGGFGHDTPFIALSGRFETHELFHKVNSNAETVLDAYFDWVKDRDRTFALLHLADPHIPINPPDPYWEQYNVDRSIDNIENWEYNSVVNCNAECQRYRSLRRRLYQAAVRYVDDAIERFVDTLEEKIKDPLLIVTSDHGEAMWEHVETDVEFFDGIGCVDHGGTPYEQVARVPLLTNADWSFDGPTTLVDVAPTLLDTVGIDAMESSGYSLGESVPDSRQILIEGTTQLPQTQAVYDQEYKLIVSKENDVRLGYKLPEERQVEIPSEVQERMISALPSESPAATGRTDVADVVEDRLNQLGYH